MEPIGQRYFKFLDDDTLETLRIIGYKNKNTVKVLHEKTNEVFITDISFFEERDYNKLNADASLVISIVELQNNLEDIICALYTRDTLTSGSMDSVPYCVCRQNITDLFSNQIKNKKINGKDYVGCCVSKDTCPANVDYTIMMTCNGIKSYQNIVLYINDKFEDIMRLIKTKEFDITLENIFNSHMKYIKETQGELIYIANKDKSKYYGYCKSLEDLLRDNNFMYDFRQAFNITPVNLDLSDIEGKSMSKELNTIVESIVLKRIDRSLVVKYDKDIDLTKLKDKYVMISDYVDDIYLIVFTESDIPYNPSDEDIILSYKYIKFENSKYL